MTAHERAVSVAVPAERADPAPPRVSYLVARLDRLLRRRLAGALAPFAVSLPEYTAMSILGRRAGLSNAQLARRTYVSPQAIQQITEGLIARGLIVRAPDQRGGRVLPATLTAAGRDLLARCDAAVDELEERMMARLRPGARQALLEGLLDCVDGLRPPVETGD
jgi:DNA-binding MarR family transcriptional regulator